MAIAGKILHGLDAATMSDQQRRKGTPQPCGAANSAAANRSRLVAVETCDAASIKQLHCIKDKDIPYFARALRADLRDIFIGFGR